VNIQPSEIQIRAEIERRRRVKVRGSLEEFARSQGFAPAAHHLLLIAELEAVERGDNDILLIEMPPGSAKSTYVNFLFPAWALSRHKDWMVLTCSHASELAQRWGRRTRNLVAFESPLLNVALSDDSQAAGRWALATGGEYYAVGVGVGIMGFRADLGIIDDPFGSRSDAESKIIRDGVWEWYLNDFSSRLKPGARRVIMHQRFHEDDVAGRLVAQLDAIGKPYRRLKIRAESLGPIDDPLGREAGVLLWDDPAGYNYGKFLRDRKAELVGDPRTWSALYQQEPVPDTGTYFKAEWLLPVDILPPRDTLRVYGGSDYAVTANGGDFTVHAVLGLDPDGNPWLLDIWRGQASSDVWVESFCDLVIKHRPMAWAEETGQIKSGVGPFLEREMRQRRAYCAREQFPTRGDKAVRAQSFRGLCATRGLRVPSAAPWRAEFESELLRFPAGVHDDQVDACGLVGQLLDKMIGGQKPEAPEKKRVNDYTSSLDRDMADIDPLVI
jgi:predicted phage terminase large subunit-like protein